MYQRRNFTEGYSLIDAMMALALLAIVFSSWFALNSRSVEANVSEALVMSVEAMSALEATCSADSKAVVRDNLDAGYLYVPSGGDEDYLRRITLGADCARDMMVVVVWTAATGAEIDPIVEFSTATLDEGMRWQCRLIAGEPRHVPDFCRISYRTSSI